MTPNADDAAIEVQLLGRFGVTIDERVIGADAWPSRRASELVQLLALAMGRSLSREQVIDALWPHLEPRAAAANLRKAAHHARRALGVVDSVVLRQGRVELFPGREVRTDLTEVLATADAALERRDADEAAAAAVAFGSDLLPESLYEEWTQEARRHLRTRREQVLRLARRWEELLDLDPADEAAYRELMRDALAAGNRHAAVQWYGRLRAALLRDLGAAPDPESDALYEVCVRGMGFNEPAFVGRQVELARVEAALHSDGPTPESLFIVRGPAGIGKSTLCQQIASIAPRNGWSVLYVSTVQAARPYGAVVRLIDAAVERDRAVLDRVDPRGREVLQELAAAELATSTTGQPLTRHQVLGAVEQLLAGASASAPVIAIVDDVEQADEASIEVLLQLPASTPAHVVFVLAARNGPSAAGLDAGLRALSRSGRLVCFDLEALADDEAAALVVAAASTAPSSGAVEEMMRLAGGNPFFLVELARRADSDGRPADPNAVLSRFLDIAEPYASMLGRLALTGGDLDPDEIAALTASTEDDAFGLLDAALSEGVLVVANGRYRFRHDLVRQALAARLPPHQQVAIHRDAARRLERSGAPPALIARHWLAGKRPDAATPWALAAGRHALRLGAYEDALAHLASVLAHEPRHVEALRLCAEALDALGRGGAPAAYAAAAEAVGAGAGADDLRAQQALAQLKLGDFAGALETIDGVEPTTLEGRLAQALTLSGVAAIGLVDPEAAASHAADSRRLALQLGDPVAVVAASWAQALAAHARGQLRESLQVDVRDTSSLPELAIAVFDGQLCVTQRLLYGAAPYPEVIAFADSLGAEADRIGAVRGGAFARTLRGEALLLSGQLAAADHELVAAGDLHRSISAPTGEAHVLQRRAQIAAREGRRVDARRLIDEALHVARHSRVEFHLLDRIYGTAIEAADDIDAAMAVVDEAEFSIRGPVETCPGCRITFVVPAAIAAARAADLERANVYLAAAEMLAEVVMQLPAWDAAVDEARGHLARATGQHARAEALFRAATKRFGDAGQPLDAARCAASS